MGTYSLKCNSCDKVASLFLAVFLPHAPLRGVPMLVFFAETLSSKLISMSFLRVVVVVVYPQMLSVALLCVCAVAYGRVSARSDSGNFLDDKWLTGKWDKFRDVSCIFGWLLFTPSPSSLAQPFLSTFIRSGSCAPPFLVMSQRRVMGPFVVFSHVYHLSL